MEESKAKALERKLQREKDRREKENAEKGEIAIEKTVSDSLEKEPSLPDITNVTIEPL